ncbi:hypothetical protein [Bacterioplanoides pacificum]|uniref:Uncharacterized protein n=1 Tax=Bacterioplanoides pacificum TaxID=1171596 RepID=A0ABV7VUT1_9GAMM
MNITPERAITYTLGVTAVALCLATGNKPALLLLAAVYAVRRLRAFQRLMS